MGWVAWRKGAGLHYKRLEAFSEMKSANYWGIRRVESRNFFKNAPSIESWANALSPRRNTGPNERKAATRLDGLGSSRYGLVSCEQHDVDFP